MKRIVVLSVMILMTFSVVAQNDNYENETFVYGQIMRRHTPDCSSADNVVVEFGGEVERCISDGAVVSAKINGNTPMMRVMNWLAARHWQLVCCYTDDCGLTVWMIRKELKYFTPIEQAKIKRVLPVNN